MSVASYSELREHVGHKIECVCYGDGRIDGAPANVALECVECSLVLLDFDASERIKELRSEIEEVYRLGRVPERQLMELYDLTDDGR